MSNFGINLNLLIDELNKHISGPERHKVFIRIFSGGDLRFNMGEVTFFSKPELLNMVLEKNKVNYQEPEEVYSLLSKYVANQLFASTGKKVFPEVIGLPNDHVHS